MASVDLVVFDGIVCSCGAKYSFSREEHQVEVGNTFALSCNSCKDKTLVVVVTAKDERSKPKTVSYNVQVRQHEVSK